MRSLESRRNKYKIFRPGPVANTLNSLTVSVEESRTSYLEFTESIKEEEAKNRDEK